METEPKVLLAVHQNRDQLIDQIRSHLNDIQIDFDRIIVLKSFIQLEETFVWEDELGHFQTIAIIGASIESLKQFNQRVRMNGLNDNLRLIFANTGQTSAYLFTDCGPNDQNLSFGDYLKTLSDANISDESHQYFDPLNGIICGLICGQLSRNCSEKQTKQLFSYKIDPQIVEYKFESERPVVVIGLGSLGFEIVKQLARIGAKNMILIDSDSIHNYNLKQNLFINTHIGLKKCNVVKEFVLNFNDNIKVEAFCAKAQQASTKFFEDMAKANAVIISAVDNIEAKRFLNKVCLNHCLPIIDCGIDRHMFHIQPIVPHLTESYFTYSDPSDPDYPLCVIKSFPQIIEHCVQWAQNKFDNWFNKRPKTADNWVQCIHTSRLIFEKFFHLKIKQLLFSIPLDRKDENGSDFWSERQAPHPLEFDLSNDFHKCFLILCAQLMATVNNIEIPENIDLAEALSSLIIPEFVPKSDKQFITDPLVTQTPLVSDVDFALKDGIKRIKYSRDIETHLKFIYTLSNLRANMYSIERASIYEITRIHNNIIDCFGSTLSTTSAMVSIELIKLLQLNANYQTTGENVFQNCNHFYNLSDLDSSVTSVPKRPNKTKLSNTCYLTEWDQWLINESENMSTLEELLNELQQRSGSICTMMVMDDSKSIYLPEIFPHHLKRKKQTMRDIIANYYTTVPTLVSLSVSFELENEEISGPNIKYVFNPNLN